MNDLAPTQATKSANESLSEPRVPRVWPVFLAIVLALMLAVFLQIVVVGAIVAIELGSGTPTAELSQKLSDWILTPLGFISMAALGQLAFAVAGFVPAIKSPEPFRQRIAWKEARPSWRVYPMTMMGSIFVLAVGLAAAYGLSKIISADSSLETVFDRMTIPWAIAFVLFIGIVPGIVEEVLFRGYIQQRLVKRWGVAKGIIVTSLLFALVHVTPHAIAAVIPLGFWLGYVAWRSGSILPGILCHLFVNAGLNAWRMIAKFCEVSEESQFTFHVSAVAIGAICFAICLAPRFWQPTTS